MSVQQDVLDTIGPEGIEKDRLREKVGNIGQAELDCVVNALMRAGRLRLVFGRYEIIDSARPLGDMRGAPSKPIAPSKSSRSPSSSTLGDCSELPATLVAQLSPSAQREIADGRSIQPSGTTPDAAAEAAASLRPTSEPTAYCTGCKARHPESAFKRGTSGRLYNQCREYRTSQARKHASGPRSTGAVLTNGGLTKGPGECVDMPADTITKVDVDPDRMMTYHVRHWLQDARAKETALLADLETVRARIAKYESFLKLDPPKGDAA